MTDDSMAEFTDPAMWPRIQQELRNKQRMATALQKIIEVDNGQTVISLIARKAIEGKEL